MSVLAAQSSTGSSGYDARDARATDIEGMIDLALAVTHDKAARQPPVDPGVPAPVPAHPPPQWQAQGLSEGGAAKGEPAAGAAGSRP
jgi:hypothetical protein